MRFQAEMFRRSKRAFHLIDRPFGAYRGVPAHFRRREAIEGSIIGRVDRDELPMEVADGTLLGVAEVDETFGAPPALPGTTAFHFTRYPRPSQGIVCFAGIEAGGDPPS